MFVIFSVNSSAFEAELTAVENLRQQLEEGIDHSRRQRAALEKHIQQALTTSSGVYPGLQTRHYTNAGSMLDRRRRRRVSIGSMLAMPANARRRTDGVSMLGQFRRC